MIWSSSVGMMVSKFNLIEFMLRETNEGSNCHNLKIIKQMLIDAIEIWVWFASNYSMIGQFFIFFIFVIEYVSI